MAAVYEGLRAAKVHLDGTSKGTFRPEDTTIFLVNVSEAAIRRSNTRPLFVKFGSGRTQEYKVGTREEIHFAGPIIPFAEICLTDKELQDAKEQTSRMAWLMANLLLTHRFLQKINDKLDAPKLRVA